MRREVFFTLDGFSENYRDSCIEDIELGYRLTRAGYAIRLCKTLQVKHLKRWDMLSLLKADVLRRALPWTQLIVQSRHFPNDLNLRWASRGSIALLCLLPLALGLWRWWPAASVVVGGGLLGTLLLLNLPLYRFLWRKRGLRFALRSIPCHWLYYAYSGLTFAFGLLRALCTSSPTLDGVHNRESAAQECQRSRSVL